MQCVIYDSNQPDARLIGIEYIISARLFGSLAEEEKRYWHSHQYEVKSGQLTAPGIPQPIEHEMMKKLVNTYGKTWHTWQYDLHANLPIGVPQLMMGFTEPGQARQPLIQEVEQEIGYSVEQRMKDRQTSTPRRCSRVPMHGKRGACIRSKLDGHSGARIICTYSDLQLERFTRETFRPSLVRSFFQVASKLMGHAWNVREIATTRFAIWPE